MADNEQWTEADLAQLVEPLDRHYYDAFAETMAKRGYVYTSLQELDKAAKLAANLLVHQSQQPTQPSQLDRLHEKIASERGISPQQAAHDKAAYQQKISECAMDPVLMYSVDVLSQLQG